MQRSFSPGLTDLSSGEVIVVSNMSTKPVAGATLADLDPVERARLRQFIERFNGDRALLELDDAQLDAALPARFSPSGSRPHPVAHHPTQARRDHR